MADVKNICGYDVKDASARSACSSLDTRVTALEQGGIGDMTSSVYDPQGTVANAGGIVSYVSAQIASAITDAIGGGY